MAFVPLLLQILPQLIQLGMEVIPLVERALPIAKGEREPTAEDWDALHAAEAEMRNRLNNPAP